ncbi:MAG: ergothioneine biosynthesis protein EgtB [Sphingomonadaceae bacterium]|nr:ergothioneine biosynthesis protein EgtB [Sphingomonadaceae bacterium]
MATAAHAHTDDLKARFFATRALTLAVAAPLSDADATVQSMPDASPAKWHLAHTTWFLETFVLSPLGVPPFDPAFGYLFNSYYEAAGPRHPRGSRGLLTRPSLDRVRAWRQHVDAVLDWRWSRLDAPALAMIELGIAHEQQHQELLLTDILHLFAANPLSPAVYDAVPPPAAQPQAGWTAHPGGIVRIGHEGGGFAFDCEGPTHDVLLAPFALADALVTTADWEAFVADGGYDDPRLWLSDGWAWRQREGIAAPLHWRGDGREFTLAGEVERRAHAPIAHVSFFEADAFAAWAGARLPTEVEWEAAAASADPAAGNQLDGPGAIAPCGDRSLFGDVWAWTASAFLPYPRFRPAEGAVGEYNGKFMSGQMVLRGASCATPRGSSRRTTRNFFPPTARWQFSGVRLAKDL